MKHTPAPWKITHRLSLGLIQPVVENADGFRLATVNAVGDKETVEANTRLISLAPELAEALKELLSVVNVRIDDPRCATFDKARALLAKLEG